MSDVVESGGSDHPDDQAARIRLRDHLVRLRTESGLSQREFAPRFGREPSVLGRMERGRNWHLATLQAWGRGLGTPLRFELDGVVLDDSDPVAAMYAAVRPKTDERRDALDRAVLRNDLVRLRRQRGLSAAAVSRAAGLSERAVSHREEDDTSEMLLSTTQQWARGLGSRLVVRVEDGESERQDRLWEVASRLVAAAWDGGPEGVTSVLRGQYKLVESEEVR